MIERAGKAKCDSDSAYFYDLMILAECTVKIVACSLIAGIEDDKDRNKYRQLHRIVRADGVGEWASVIDEIVIGVTSQFLQDSLIQHEQKEIQTKVEAHAWQYQTVKHLLEIFPIVGLSVVPLPKRLQLRQWFSYFSQLRNATRGHGAVPPSKYSSACLHLETSIKVFIENFFLFKREWAYLHQNLNGKYRVLPINGNSSSFENLKKSSEFGGQFINGLYLLYDRKTHVELIESDSDGIDFFFPNGNFRDKSFELLSYFSNERISGDGSKYLTPANDLPESETEGLGALVVQGNVFGNVPLLPVDYIARKDLEKSLKQILDQTDRYPIVTLVGRGGIGKTTLALSVLHQVSQSNRYNVIVWFSSRDIDLKLDGPKSVKNNILREEDLASEYVNLVSPPNISRTSEKIKFFSDELTKSNYGSVLFVLDNFETVQNPTELFNWIDTYVRHPNKILITSRISKSFKADYPIEIQGMNHDECLELIEGTTKNLRIFHLVDETVKDELISEAEGHPYVIKILLGEIAKKGKVGKVERIMANQDDILVALFRRTYNTLTAAAKRVFLTLCSWRSAVPVIALEAVLLRPEIKDKIDVEEVVEELRKSSFIDVTTNSADAFINVPLAAFLFGKGELEVSPMKLAILSDRELLQEFGVTQVSDLKNGIFPRIEKKFKAIAAKATSAAFNLEDHLPTLEFICRKFPYAWNFLYQLHIENDQMEKASEALREYLKNEMSNEEKRFALNKLAEIYRKQKDYLGEVNSLTELCLIPTATLRDISETANTVNKYLYNDEAHPPILELDTEIKESLVRKIAEVMSRKMYDYATATDYSRLAWLYLNLQLEEKAIDAIEKGLAKDMNNPYCYKLALRFNLL